MVEVAVAETEGVLAPEWDLASGWATALAVWGLESVAGCTMESVSDRAWTDKVVGSGCWLLVFTRIELNAPRMNIPAPSKALIIFSLGSMFNKTQADNVPMYVIAIPPSPPTTMNVMAFGVVISRSGYSTDLDLNSEEALPRFAGIEHRGFYPVSRSSRVAG